ncbi:MAG: NYN domain-containing protein [Clostridia bacterium]
MFSRKTDQKGKQLFNHPTNGLPKAAAFVDYEHWYVSLARNFDTRPNIKGWYEDLCKRVNLTEVVFFADFSHKSLADEIQRIRPFSNKIIDTRNPNGVKKDFTDFIILDNIYQKALTSSDIDVFILFSGDGHFSSVASFLKNIYSKEVGIYGIEGSFSRQLQQTASWCVTLPTQDDVHGLEYRLIFDELKTSTIIHTEKSLIEKICASNKTAKSQNIKNSLDKLMIDGVIVSRTINRFSTKEPQLFVDWERVQKEGYIEK